MILWSRKIPPSEQFLGIRLNLISWRQIKVLSRQQQLAISSSYILPMNSKSLSRLQIPAFKIKDLALRCTMFFSSNGFQFTVMVFSVLHFRQNQPMYEQKNDGTNACRRNSYLRNVTCKHTLIEPGAGRLNLTKSVIWASTWDGRVLCINKWNNLSSFTEMHFKAIWAFLLHCNFSSVEIHPCHGSQQKRKIFLTDTFVQTNLQESLWKCLPDHIPTIHYRTSVMGIIIPNRRLFVVVIGICVIFLTKYGRKNCSSLLASQDPSLK